MSKQYNHIRRTVMRRVYATFAARLITHPVTVQLSLAAVAIVVFAQMVHVASVIHNLLSIEVAAVPTFVGNALWRGEVLTLLALGVLVFTALSVPWQLRSLVVPKRPQWQTM